MSAIISIKVHFVPSLKLEFLKLFLDIFPKRPLYSKYAVLSTKYVVKVLCKLREYFFPTFSYKKCSNLVLFLLLSNKVLQMPSPKTAFVFTISEFYCSEL